MGGVLSVVIVGLLGVMVWMHRKEKKERVLREHYEQQFAQSYPRRVESRAVSVVFEKEVE